MKGQISELEKQYEKEREKKENLRNEINGINQHYMKIIYEKVQEIASIKDAEHRQKRKNLKVKFSNNILKLQRTYEQKLIEQRYELEKYYGKKTDRSMSQSYNSKNNISHCEHQAYHEQQKTLQNRPKSVGNKGNHHKSQSYGITAEEFMSTLQLGLQNSQSSFESTSKKQNSANKSHRKRKSATQLISIPQIMMNYQNNHNMNTNYNKTEHQANQFGEIQIINTKVSKRSSNDMSINDLGRSSSYQNLKSSRNGPLNQRIQDNSNGQSTQNSIQFRVEEPKILHSHR